MSVVSQSIDDAYFTNPETVEFVHKILKEAGWLNGTVLEPCCGEGYLVKGLDNVTAWDMNQYEHPLDRVGNFLEQNTGERFDLMITNPPFGKMGQLACDILNHGTKFTDRVAIILPQCFRKIQRIDRVNEWFHPVGDYNLPNENYILPDGQIKYVRTCFQMWERRDYKRFKFGNRPYTEFFRQVSAEDADYYLRTHGHRAGLILEGNDLNLNTGRYLKFSNKVNKDLVAKYDWKKIARFASGAPCFGLHDVAWALRSPNIEKYLVHGVMYDLINGFYDEKGATLF
jgi:hypothetical protein